MKFAKSFALVASVVLSSASVAVATDVNITVNNNQERAELTNEASGRCRPWEFSCISL
jgi:hypothetical protein